MKIDGKTMNTLYKDTSRIDGIETIKTAWKGIHIGCQSKVNVDGKEMHIINLFNVMEEDNTATQYVTLQG